MLLGLPQLISKCMTPCNSRELSPDLRTQDLAVLYVRGVPQGLSEKAILVDADSSNAEPII